MRKVVLDACQLQASELFLCAIHTHSAPTLTLDSETGHSNNVAYTKALQGTLIEVTRQAMEALAPVQIGVGTGASPVGCNRREVVHDGSGKTRVALGRNPSASIDREVQVLKLVRPGEPGGMVGAVFAYATHSTSLGPRNHIISGDLHAIAEQFVEKQSGPGVVAPGFAGFRQY